MAGFRCKYSKGAVYSHARTAPRLFVCQLDYCRIGNFVFCRFDFKYFERRNVKNA